MNSNLNPNMQDPIELLETKWNLPQWLVLECDVYELLRLSRVELRLRVYKQWYKETDVEGNIIHGMRTMLLHKGQLYDIRWQYESLEAYYLVEHWPDTTQFIVSIRRRDDKCVAIVQRKRS